MADHYGRHDTGSGELNSWLSEPVRPLQPPPGAFEQIKRRARRRKLRQVAWSAGGAALLIAAGVTVPRLVVPQLSPGHPIAGNPPGHDHPRRATQSSGPPPSPMAKRPTPLPTAVAAGGPEPPAPANFQPSSITFVGTHTGWVIGQAGTPGHCGPPSPYICTSIARTDNAGRTWYGVRAPVTGPPDGPRGVGQIRFLDGYNGWAFGPELWATHDGGQRWARVGTRGLRVTALETSGGRAFAVWARCGPGLPRPASGCTAFTLYSAAAAGDRWEPVPGATGLTAGRAASAPLVLTGSSVYLLAPTGELLTLTGPATGMHAVTRDGTPVTVPCATGRARAGGRAAGALLAALGSPGQGLALLCPGTAAGSVQEKTLYYSGDGGATWRQEGSAPVGGIATSLAGTPSGAVVLATTRGIDVAARPGGPWRAATVAPLPGGFSYVGMTTSQQGVAVPADTRLHAVWFSYDGGLRWQESRIP